MQKVVPLYADVILPLAVTQYYTYRIPDHILEKVRPGYRVTVHVGQRKIYTGIIRKLHNLPPAGIQINEILSLLDEDALLSEKQLGFWEWIADYYLCTPGEVYRAALPSGLKLESESRIFAEPIENTANSYSSPELQLLDLVSLSPGITIQKLALAAGKKDILPVIKTLLEKGAIVREENLKTDYKPRTRDYVLLTETYQISEKLNELSNFLENRAPKQAQLMLGFIELSGYDDEQAPQPVSKEKLLNISHAGHAALNALVKKGVLQIQSEEVSRLSLAPEIIRKPFSLNETQTRALVKIIDEFTRKEVVLLHGVTSSGKTEIYIHLIEHYIRQEKQVLYLLPEIALTAQMIQRLRAVFGNTVGVYHSKFSDAERVEVYENLAGKRKKGSPEYQIILGVRSSVFLPFSRLGLVIVDEEHENTYKQFDPAPRYNARDASVVLAAMHGAKVLMGTATPSFESYLNAVNGRYGLVELFERYLDIQLPETIVVDTRQARKRKLMHTHFSAALIDHITGALNGHEQVILFQNRRGFSPYIECTACGWIPHCKHCDVSLTYHKKLNRLNCHYCGFSIPNPPSCSSCGDTNLQTRGFGTEKVEDEIKTFFPKARVSRMDMDTTRTRKSYEKIIDDFTDQKTDILIGTQMISKGLDFDHVSLVGILNADNMMNFPDFRSFERSYQLIAQVSGRAGRKQGRGKVIVQTGDPEHTVIRHVLDNDYKGFFTSQLKERQTYKYPPYFRLVKLTLRHKKLPVVTRAAQLLATELRKSLGDRVIGPEFPLISRVYSLHQKCIMVKIERDKQFSERRKLMRLAIDQIMIHGEFKSLQIIPDVDPYN